ncbi:MAG: hypothetical protein AAB658_19480, partial [Chloroflexota bacterium]
MKQNTVRTLCSVGIMFLGAFGAAPARAFNQPPANLSATTFMDGVAPSGLYYVNYTLFTDGRRAVDKNGNTISGGAKVDALTQLHQLYY